MSLLKRKSSSIDPSNFLWALRNTIIRDHGLSFNSNSQQDVPEILQIVIDELKGISQVADNIISSISTISPNISHLQCLPLL